VDGKVIRSGAERFPIDVIVEVNGVDSHGIVVTAVLVIVIVVFKQGSTTGGVGVLLFLQLKNIVSIKLLTIREIGIVFFILFFYCKTLSI
jgi:hypothetical protein